MHLCLDPLVLWASHLCTHHEQFVFISDWTSLCARCRGQVCPEGYGYVQLVYDDACTLPDVFVPSLLVVSVTRDTSEAETHA